MIKYLLPVWLLAIGLYLIIIRDGEIVWCIMCGSVLRNMLGVISVLIGVIGIINIRSQRKAISQ